MKAVLKSSDNNLLVKIKNDFLKYLNDKFYMLFLLITALGSYGFLITHYSVSIDDLEYDRYYYGELIAQGRLSATIIHRLFNLTDNIIYIQDFLGLVFMCIGIILLCTFLDKYLKTKNHIPQIFFSCVFLSFPLHSELFSYGGCFFAIGSECVLMSISLLLIKEYLDTKKIGCWFLSIIPLFVITSWYESMLVVYVCAVFGVLLIEQYEDTSIKFKKVIFNGMRYALPLIIGFVSEIAASAIVRNVLKLERSYNGINFFKHNEDLSFLEQLYGWLIDNISQLCSSLFNYLPIQIFLVCALIIFIFAIYDLVKYHRFGLLICEVGLLICNFIFPLLTFQKIFYRACQSMGFFVAFILLVILYKAEKLSYKKILYKTLCVISSLIVVAQIISINSFFTTDYMRYEYEKKLMTEIGDELIKNYDMNKTVIFIGNTEMSDYVISRSHKKCSDSKIYKIGMHLPVIQQVFTKLFPEKDAKYKIQQTNSSSYINWGINCAFKEKPLENFYRYLGYNNIKMGDKQQSEKEIYANDNKNMPCWPDKGSIKVKGNYIIVCVGDAEYDQTMVK